MTKRIFLLFSLAIIGLTHANTKPNVVFILADDLGLGDVSCYGQQKFKTPNIDRLAAEGVKLEFHYSGAPVCAPSRCVLLTGKHLGHAEVRGNKQAQKVFPEFKEGQIPLTPAAITLPSVLQKAGYNTGAMGKWGLGPVGSTGDPNKQGFDLFFGQNCQAAAHSFYPKYLWRNSEQVLLNAKPVAGHAKPVAAGEEVKSYTGERYASYEMIAEAEKFLEKQKGGSKPFFLYLPFLEPHVAMHPPESEVAKFPLEWDKEPYRGENGYLPHARPRAAYAAMISMLDGYVGRVLAALEAHGMTKNTLVIFTSDNGPTHAGQPDISFHIGGCDAKFFNSNTGLAGYKGSVQEGGLRVPCLARFPGKLPAGTISKQPSYFADWFPTLCAATGVEQPAGLDGDNLWPSLTQGTALAKRKPMLWIYPEYGGQVAVRIGHFKVMRRDLARKSQLPWEVFDISKDPQEQHNLAKEKPELVAEAMRILKAETAENTHFPVKLPEA